MVKAAKGEIPEGIKVRMNKNTGELFFQNQEGRVVGKLTPRSNQSIIDEYNPLIKALNDKYGFNIAEARLNNRGQIEWPNIYGILYKKGG